MAHRPGLRGCPEHARLSKGTMEALRQPWSSWHLQATLHETFWADEVLI